MSYSFVRLFGMVMGNISRDPSCEIALWTALANCYSHARRLDLLVLAPLSPEEIPFRKGNIIIRTLGDRIGNDVFWEENYTNIFRELNVTMRNGH
jgi:hypothetical protein